MPKPALNDPLPFFLVKPEIPSPELRSNNLDDGRERKRERRRDTVQTRAERHFWLQFKFSNRNF